MDEASYLLTNFTYKEWHWLTKCINKNRGANDFISCNHPYISSSTVASFINLSQHSFDFWKKSFNITNICSCNLYVNIIFENLNCCIQYVTDDYLRQSYIEDCQAQVIKIEGDEIKLDISADQAVVWNGWKVLTLTYPQVIVTAFVCIYSCFVQFMSSLLTLKFIL